MKILEIVGEIDGGGVAAVVYNYLSHMDMSCMEVHILAFCMDGNAKQILEDPLKALGCKVIWFRHRNTGYREHFRRYRRLLEEEHYDIVHCHFGIWSTPYVMLASRAGVRVRISHSHGAGDDFSGLKLWLLNAARPLLYKYTTHRFACGRMAGEYLWGKRDFLLMTNAVDSSRFAFNEDLRRLHRSELGLSGHDVLIGHVGRFSFEKNHPFMLQVMARLHQISADFRMVLAGRGNDFEKIREQAESLGLGDSVLFLGVRNDVNELLSAMDILLLPSFHEGFPVVAVEAQCSGLPVLVSDKVTSEALLTDQACSLPIDNGVEPWVKAIVGTSERLGRMTEGELCACRSRQARIVKEKGFDISTQAAWLRDVYMSFTDTLR